MGLHRSFVALIIIIFLQNSHLFHISEFLIDYFIQHEIHAVNIFVCNQSDAISIHKNFQQKKVPFVSLVHTLDLENNNHVSENFMSTEDLNYLGIFIDFNCKNFSPLIEEVLSELVNDCCYHVLFWNKLNNNELFTKYSVSCGTKLILARTVENTITLYDLTITTNIAPLGYWENGSLFMENPQVNKHESQNQVLHGIISFTDQNIQNNSVTKFKNEEIFYLKLSTLAYFSMSIYRSLRVMYDLQWEITIISNPSKLMEYTDIFLNVSADSFDFIITSENHFKSITNGVVRLPSIKTIRQCFVFRHPPVYSYKTFFFKPFSIGLWLCLGIFLIASAILLYLMCLIKIEDVDHNELSIFGNTLYCLGALINQGLSVPSRRSSKRIIQFNILQLSLFISNFYSAVILNYLLYPTHSTINELDDIINQGFDIGYEDTIYNNNTFSVNTSEVIQYGFGNMIVPYNITTGIEKIRNSKFSFLSIDSNIYEEATEYLEDTEMCELSSIPLKSTYDVSMYLRRNSPFKENFQKGILLLKETGIINHEDETWNKRNQKCLGVVKYVEIGLQETSIAIEIFLIGFICSAFIFILEFIIAKFKFWAITLKNQN